MSLLDTASLIVTPNGYKEGKLYSVVPSDGSGDMSVVRATTATRVNSAGLVELVPYNLVTWSQDFSNGNWIKSSSTVVSNSITAPDGTLTADTQIVSAQFGGFNQFIGNLSTGSIYNISFWAKKLTGTNTYSVIDNSGGSGIIGTFTPTTEWVRYTFSFTAASAAMTLFPAQDRNGSGFGSIYIWGAQVNEGTIKDYQKTETRLNIPRLDYSNGTCPSLLVEPQRTNILLRSQEFDNASWVKVNTSVTANTTASPDGNSNADSLIENTATNLHLTYQFFTSVSLTTYSFSCYIKPDTRTRVYLRSDTSVGTVRTLFDLTGAGSVVTLAHTSASITAVANGWYKCIITFTEAVGLGSRLVAIEGAVGTSISYAGNGLNAFYLWGAQLEVGAYPSSYIPTTSASVTRNADVISKTGISSLIGQTEGTLFFDGVINGCQNSSANILNSERNTTASFFIGYIKSTNRILAGIYSSGTEPATFVGGSVAIGSRFKVAYAYKSGSSTLYVNGVQIGTSSTTFTLPSTIDDLYISDQTTFFSFGESVTNNVTSVWKTRLTNTQLEQLTTI
jgi:hypothetical protein